MDSDNLSEDCHLGIGSLLIPEPVPKPIKAVYYQVAALFQLGALVARSFVDNHLDPQALIFIGALYNSYAPAVGVTP